MYQVKLNPKRKVLLPPPKKKKKGSRDFEVDFTRHIVEF